MGGNNSDVKMMDVGFGQICIARILLFVRYTVSIGQIFAFFNFEDIK